MSPSSMITETPLAIPMIKATLSNSPAPFEKESKKSVSFILPTKPMRTAPTKKVAVISTNHQSKTETPMIMMIKLSEKIKMITFKRKVSFKE